MLDRLKSARVYDLGVPYFVGMPHFPTHAPFLFSLTKVHGEVVLAGGTSSAAEAIALGSHVGTHMDALCHFSKDGKWYSGVETRGRQSYAGGMEHYSIDTVTPVVRRGVLLDIARLQEVEVLPVEFTVTPQHLEAACLQQGVVIEPGDVVFLRTGWMRYWNDPAKYIANVHGPGPELEGARWLSERLVYAVGSDTVSFEKVPSPSMVMHVHQLRGATGAPVRPVAIVV
ncbi:MAG: cyclase family protein [Acidobacteria bacterium]|nr:cyclase family protein [Acidobacteriota bacterium]